MTYDQAAQAACFAPVLHHGPAEDVTLPLGLADTPSATHTRAAFHSRRLVLHNFAAACVRHGLHGREQKVGRDTR